MSERTGSSSWKKLICTPCTPSLGVLVGLLALVILISEPSPVTSCRCACLELLEDLGGSLGDALGDIPPRAGDLDTEA